MKSYNNKSVKAVNCKPNCTLFLPNLLLEVLVYNGEVVKKLPE